MEQKKPHLQVGLAIGAMLGVAAGLFMQSRKGKQLAKDAQKKALQLQQRLMKKLDGLEVLDKETYTGLVDHVVEYFVKSKEIAKAEIPQVRTYLLGRWKAIEAQWKSK